MTIKEIAKLASVSTGTVDRVIHNRGYVNAEKRALIEKIVEESSFRPNLYARNLKLNQSTRIGFLTPNLFSESGYWKLVYEGVNRAQKDLMDVSFFIDTYEYDRNNPSSFTEAAEKMIQSNPDGCLIIPKCQAEARDFLLANPDLNFVLLDSFLSGVSPLCAIGQNFYDGGFLAGKLISLMQPNAEKILTFSFMESKASKERIRGFNQFFSSTEVANLDIMSTGDVRQTFYDFFAREGEFDAIFSPCSLGHLVGDIVVDLGWKDKTRILTYDLIPENKRALLHGTIDCILSQRPVFQGYSGIYQIYRALVQKQQIEKEINVQVDIIFRENVPPDYDEGLFGKLNQYCMSSTLF